MKSASGQIVYPALWHEELPSDELRPYPQIRQNWEQSKQVLERLSRELREQLGSPAAGAGSFAVAVAGSLGRMEACTASDLDYMIVCGDQAAGSGREHIVAVIECVAQKLDLPMPNPEGVFGPDRVFEYKVLMDETGSTNDTVDRLSQRMLLLMESRPVYNAALYGQAITYLLNHYLEDVAREPHKDAVFLMNDIIRYFRTVCVSYQNKVWTEGDKWCVRNVKLRHSRVVMYAGLLLPVLNASLVEDKPAYLRDMMDRTPLERIVSVYRQADDTGYRRLMSAYELFLHCVADERMRRQLQVEYAGRWDSQPYRAMRVSAMAITSELLRFLLEQRGRWSESVFEYLLF